MELLRKIFGMRTMGLLMIIFGVTIGVATFIENDYGTPAAKAWIYNHTWFETLMALMVINMVVVIFTHRLYRKEKLVNLVFHLAFIVILLGAGITRYFGYEGIMPIREGEKANTFVSENSYVSVWVNGEDIHDERVLFSRLGRISYSKDLEYNGNEIKVEISDFIPNAITKIEDDPENGKSIITLVTAGPGGRENNYLVEGSPRRIGGILASFNDTTFQAAFHIIKSDSGLMMQSQLPVQFVRMADQYQGEIEANTWTPFLMRQLYVVGNTNFVFSDYNPHGKVSYVPEDNPQSKLGDIATFTITSGEESQSVRVSGGRGIQQNAQTVKLNGMDISVAYGSQLWQLPFHIQLTDFQLERYPGSESPSSYSSEVILIDEKAGINMPFRIYMNNILDHGGYRFYQSSYDPDELGTYLSVNFDYWGTFVTYWGYFFLAVGLIAIFFSKDTRFGQLNKMIENIHKKRLTQGALIIMFFTSINVVGQEATNLVAPSKEHAANFGKVLVQKQDGRITPINTFSNEIVRKLTKSDTYKGFTADQVFLGMISHPQVWREEKMIRVNHQDLYPILSIDDKYASFLDFFTQSGEYKLKTFVDEAYQKKPAERNKMDKEVIAVDERVNITYMTFTGAFLKIFPIPGHPENNWTTPVQPTAGMAREDSLFVTGFIPLYFETMESGIDSGDYSNADELLTGIRNYQAKFGAEVLPSPTKVKLEIMYNNYNLFKRLFPYYMLVGFLFLIVLYIRLLRPKTPLKYGILSLQGLIFLGFTIHGIGLGIRWYISGHEPWSNGYESMLYIAWAGLLAGLIFVKKSPITMAVTAILAGIILFVAHLSWMDPEITNLVPVLKSYWLTIHVATITASYGFLALGALLAFVNLITMIMRRAINRDRLNLTIKEVTYVIEMTLTVGLVLLTIGNFLGGIWANESWGRYWGWDPKETWAMATIIFYGFVLHMRFIPGFRGTYAFNLAALITFSSVLMTYFGVNFYLSGLHSYAKGDPVPVPDFVYYTLGIIAFVASLAFMNEIIDRKHSKSKSNGKPSSSDLKGINLSDSKRKTVES